MSTLETVTKKAKSLYSNNGEEIKTVLEQVFGKETFVASITDRIQTVEAAYADLKIDRSALLPIKGPFMTDARFESLCAEIDAEIVVMALNEGVELSYADKNQKKWKIWWKHDGHSGFGFYYSYSVFEFTFTLVGSRLDFASQELAKHFAEYFTPLINKISNK